MDDRFIQNPFPPPIIHLHCALICPFGAPIALLSAGFGLERGSAMPYLVKKSWIIW